MPFNVYLDPVPANAVYPPFSVQHALLTAIQKFLEEVLFYWAQRNVPDLLRVEGWETPEAGEFNAWWQVLKRRPTSLNHLRFRSVFEIETLFTRLAHVRHLAVHRRRTHSQGFPKMFTDAIVLAEGFEDHLRAENLRHLQYAFSINDFRAVEEAITKPFQGYFGLPLPARSKSPPTGRAPFCEADIYRSTEVVGGRYSTSRYKGLDLIDLTEDSGDEAKSMLLEVKTPRQIYSKENLCRRSVSKECFPKDNVQKQSALNTQLAWPAHNFIDLTREPN